MASSAFISKTDPKLFHLQFDKLGELLAVDYGREPSCVIFVNGERVFHHDIQGGKFQTGVTEITISDKCGLLIETNRVHGRMVRC